MREGEAVVLANSGGDEHQGDGGSLVDYAVDIYPLSRYYFGTKDALSTKDETPADSLLRLKSNYEVRGLRTSVQGVILVELFKHPHLLLLQVKNTTFNLPGGRLRQGDSVDLEGLQRKLSRKLSPDEGSDNSDEIEWEVGDLLGMWWRPEFEALLYPYLPPNTKQPKECTKLFMVKLPVCRKFIVPKNMKLLAVPLCQVHGNHKTYGSIIAGIPQLLSKYSFNMIEA
ncbi:pre-mRNA cleavage factor Im 25 kDa subunit 1 isoform X2 [Spinacia oleracea]|uniref:Pre-mRNA cleavage factor Im 25 kDa subunit n=1 Tax=Spinacia oleracea TaxID=3562 RepID=A0ABM3R9W5_SPIOL|nr:pre-mRNA cleavage factor Im 25 kDa subunit 1-like isoform X2 [Spinacia oleracea]